MQVMGYNGAKIVHLWNMFYSYGNGAANGTVGYTGLAQWLEKK